MDLLGRYGDEGDDDDNTILSTKPSSLSMTIVSAPSLIGGNASSSSSSSSSAMSIWNNNNNNSNNNGNMMMRNMKASEMLKPSEGPAHPFRSSFHNVGNSDIKRCGMGYVEDAAIDEYVFNEQYQNYQGKGYAFDVTTNQILGDYNEYLASHNTNNTNTQGKRKRDEEKTEQLDNIGDSFNNGPWAPMPEQPKIQLKQSTDANQIKETKEDKQSKNKNNVEEIEDDKDNVEEKGKSSQSDMFIIEPDEEAEKWEKVNERKSNHTMAPRPARGSVAGEAKSTFHGTSERDYQGRVWTKPPAGIRSDGGNHDCFIPKKCIKKYTGHTKGIQEIDIFPGTGHLVLSGGLDGKCKIWEVYGDRNVKRTYIGHSEAVRSVNMSSDGSKFLSSSFDRYIRLWDVETGKAIGTYSNRKMAYQVRFYPHDNNIFLCPASDNKIYQWDARSGQIVQEYNYHLAPANTVTFIDEGRKFISTSDDKKILVWEYDIPVPLKYISEVDMHSVPSVTVHPHGQYLAGQSMDNTIVVYSAGEKVKKSKKVFSGHNTAGYACQIGFSPDGQFIMSGDGHGNLWVWDWKTTRIYKKFQAHDGGPCMSALWHPIHSSWVLTAGWDGLIKLWE
jgi:pre-mRNA-processing factor 17